MEANVNRFAARLVLTLFLSIAACASTQAQGQSTSEAATETAPAAEAQTAVEDVESETAQKDVAAFGEVENPGIDLSELDIRLVPLTEAELAALTEKWQSIVQSKTTEVMEAQVKISTAPDAATEADRSRLLQLSNERDGLFEKYAVVISAWETKGGDPAEIAKYRAYRNAIIVEEARTSDFRALFDRTLAWFTDPEGGIAIVWRIVIVIAALYALLLVSKIVRSTVRRRIDRVPNISKLLQIFLVTAIYWIFLSVGLMLVLALLGVNITPLFALFGGASFIAGFALQDTLANLANGLMIMVNRPFDEGDYVDLGGVSGTVKSVSIVATTITTPDNQVIVIPNKQVWGNTITNVTASDIRRVDLVFGIGYDDDIPKAMQVLKDAVAEHPLTLDEPEPTIVVGELADNSVNLLCRPWTKTGDYWQVYWDLIRDVKTRFDAAGISIPFPQRDVHLHTVAPAAGGVTAS